jgi:hypothetical protein
MNPAQNSAEISPMTTDIPDGSQYQAAREDCSLLCKDRWRRTENRLKNAIHNKPRPTSARFAAPHRLAPVPLGTRKLELAPTTTAVRMTRKLLRQHSAPAQRSLTARPAFCNANSGVARWDFISIVLAHND